MRKVLLLCAGLAFASAAGAAAQPESEAKAPRFEKAAFAGGCFWCMQPPFDRLKGVVSTVVGYTGGGKKNPTYEEVSAGGTGHAESIEVTYDPAQTNYAQLLDVFWHNIDPTVLNRQFCDEGEQYRTAVFYYNEDQRKQAEEAKDQLVKSGRFAQVYTQIVPASAFYPAEEYHQKYYQKNPVRYKFYRYNCGRDQTLKKIWGRAPEH